MREFAGARALSGEGRCSPVSASRANSVLLLLEPAQLPGARQTRCTPGTGLLLFFQCLHKLQTNKLPPRPLLICINEYICM